MKLHYILQLWDLATPSFCSFPKMFVGTKTAMLEVAERLEQDQSMPETSAAIRAYFAGNHAVTHSIAFVDFPILTPVRVLAESTIQLAERTWEHMNVWECPYNMRFDHAEVSQIVIRYDGRYCRCMKANIMDLCLEWPEGNWIPAGTSIWGNKCVLHNTVLPDGHIEFGNDLYILEESAPDKESLICELNDPEEIKFNGLCDEIFGDG